MSKKKSRGAAITWTVIYSHVWLFCVLSFFGFFMPTPVMMFKRLYGIPPKRTDKRYGRIIPLTIIYIHVWFILHFIIVGFFMPTPVRVFRRMNRTITIPSSKSGYSIDELNMYDALDD